MQLPHTLEVYLYFKIFGVRACVRGSSTRSDLTFTKRFVVSALKKLDAPSVSLPTEQQEH